MNQDEGSSSTSSRSSSPFDPPLELLDEYSRLVADQFDNLASIGLLPTQPSAEDSDANDAHGDAGRVMTKAEKQNAKKKRRKERERLAREQAASSQDLKAPGTSKRNENTVGKLGIVMRWLEGVAN